MKGDGIKHVSYMRLKISTSCSVAAWTSQTTNQFKGISIALSRQHPLVHPWRQMNTFLGQHARDFTLREVNRENYNIAQTHAKTKCNLNCETV